MFCQKERLINKRLFCTVIAEMCDIGVSLKSVQGKSKDSKQFCNKKQLYISKKIINIMQFKCKSKTNTYVEKSQKYDLRFLEDLKLVSTFE